MYSSGSGGDGEPKPSPYHISIQYRTQKETKKRKEKKKHVLDSSTMIAIARVTGARSSFSDFLAACRFHFVFPAPSLVPTRHIGNTHIPPGPPRIHRPAVSCRGGGVKTKQTKKLEERVFPPPLQIAASAAAMHGHVV
jgi:hypothetical protein